METKHKMQEQISVPCIIDQNEAMHFTTIQKLFQVFQSFITLIPQLLAQIVPLPSSPSLCINFLLLLEHT